MAHMTNEFSHFPEQIYDLHNFLDLKDAPESINIIVNQIKRYEAAGKFAEAAALLNDSRTALKPYFIDADVINAMEEELRNLEIYTKRKKQTIYYQNSEPDGVAGDVWIVS